MKILRAGSIAASELEACGKGWGMGRDQKNTLFVLIVLGGIYFSLFIFPNLTGAKDASMLAVFEVDEYAQYPHVLQMLSPGETFYQTLRNFLIYLHYFYGYVFYFCSAVVLLPIKLFSGENWAAQTQLNIVVLRQMINVLPMIVSVLILVYMQTRFKSLWKSAALFLFLLSLPVVLVNNLWWHPDSLVFLFIVLTLFFLQRDNFQYGKNLFAAAVACGLATGTKHLGLFFVLAIPVYLVWGMSRKTIHWKRALLLGLGFVAVMVAAIVISNPLLLLPMERAEIIATQKLQFQQTSSGLIVANSEPFIRWGHFPDDLRIHYGEWFFILFAFALLGLGLWKSSQRLLDTMILCWMIPLTATVFIFATRRTHYLLPVIVPLYSALFVFWDPIDAFSRIKKHSENWNLSNFLHIFTQLMMSGLILFQFVLFIQSDVEIINRQLHREADSQSIAFYNRVREKVLPEITADHLRVYRDWHIYFPDSAQVKVAMEWDFATHAMIEELRPDLILLEKENVKAFSNRDMVAQAIDPGDIKPVYLFYKDAAADQLQGYSKVLEDSFGVAFVRDSILQPLSQRDN